MSVCGGCRDQTKSKFEVEVRVDLTLISEELAQAHGNLLLGSCAFQSC
jgi:hypothetical protein